MLRVLLRLCSAFVTGRTSISSRVYRHVTGVTGLREGEGGIHRPADLIRRRAERKELVFEARCGLAYPDPIRPARVPELSCAGRPLP